jgi:hypothetical protein
MGQRGAKGEKEDKMDFRRTKRGKGDEMRTKGDKMG